MAEVTEYSTRLFFLLLFNRIDGKTVIVILLILFYLNIFKDYDY